jgi:hypothetical protein
VRDFLGLGCWVILRWLHLTIGTADEGVALLSKIIGKFGIKKRNSVTPLYGEGGLGRFGSAVLCVCICLGGWVVG